MTGPAATPMPTTAPHTPSAAARSRRSRKALVMIDSVVGKIRAAKTPIAARAAISAPGVVTQRPGDAGDGEADQADDQGRPPAEAVAETLPVARTRPAKARL